jgi:hypothetical protein
VENEPVAADTVPADTVVKEPVVPFTVPPLIVGALTYPDFDILAYVMPVKDALRLVTSFMECVCVKSVMSALEWVCPLNATFEPPTVKAFAEIVVAVNDAVPVTFKLVKEPVAAVTVPVFVMSVYVIPDNVVDRFVTSFMECVCPERATLLVPTLRVVNVPVFFVMEVSVIPESFVSIALKEAESPVTSAIV